MLLPGGRPGRWTPGRSGRHRRRLLEDPVGRRRTAGFVAVGAGVATLLTYAVVRGPVVATIEGHHISYEADLWRGGILTGFYVLATCGPMLGSSHRDIRWYGVVNVVAVAVLALVSASAFVSLWCVWAAVTSVAVAAHLRHTDIAPRAAVAGTARAK